MEKYLGVKRHISETYSQAVYEKMYITHISMYICICIHTYIQIRNKANMAKY